VLSASSDVDCAAAETSVVTRLSIVLSSVMLPLVHSSVLSYPAADKVQPTGLHACLICEARSMVCDKYARMQVVILAYPAQAPRMRSSFARSHLVLLVGLLERFVVVGALMASAMLSTRADGYLWVLVWQPVLLLFIVNTCMCVLAVLLNYSGSELKPAGTAQRQESVRVRDPAHRSISSVFPISWVPGFRPVSAAEHGPDRAPAIL
jgi:hypothetical protein